MEEEDSAVLSEVKIELDIAEEPSLYWKPEQQTNRLPPPRKSFRLLLKLTSEDDDVKPPPAEPQWQPGPKASTTVAERHPSKPRTARAERGRRFRERLKQNPEKYAAHLEKDKARCANYRSQLSAEERAACSKKGAERVRKSRQKKKVEKNNAKCANYQSRLSAEERAAYIKKGAERVRKSRQNKKVQRARILKKELIKLKMRDDLAAKEAQRAEWRERKRESRKNIPLSVRQAFNASRREKYNEMKQSKNGATSATVTTSMKQPKNKAKKKATSATATTSQRSVSCEGQFLSEQCSQPFPSHQSLPCEGQSFSEQHSQPFTSDQPLPCEGQFLSEQHSRPSSSSEQPWSSFDRTSFIGPYKQEILSEQPSEEQFLSEECSQVSPSTEQPLDTSWSPEAQRKALERAKAALPRSPRRYVATVVRLISTASPRARELFKEMGIDVSCTRYKTELF